MTLNVGPQHPSTHGVLRLMVTLSGEEVLEVVPHIGYLHTGFEKTMEHRTYLQNITYTPRMDYLHSFAHDLAYALAVEKLLGAVVPPRAETIRVILNELSRLASHLVFLGTGLLDLGALTPSSTPSASARPSWTSLSGSRASASTTTTSASAG